MIVKNNRVKLSVCIFICILNFFTFCYLLSLVIYDRFESVKNLNNPIELFEENNDYIKNCIISLRKNLDPQYVNELQLTILKYSKKFDIPAELLISLIFRESSFNEKALSKANCIGLMQVSPIHTKILNELNLTVNDLYVIDNNIHVGCIILNKYIKKHGDIEKALINYVGGNHKSYVLDVLKIYTNLTLKI